MKRILPALLASVLFLAPCRSFADDPSGMFLSAYQEFQAGESSERNGQLREALNRYTSTENILGSIKRANPDWQSMVVEYRLRKAKEGIERLQAAIDQLPPPPSDKPDPLQRKGFEIDIPAPGVSAVPATGAPATSMVPDSGLIRELAEARAEINRLRVELTTVNAELSSSRMEVEKVKTEMVAAKSSLAQAETSLESASQDLESLRAKVDLPPDEKVLKLSSRIADLEAENAFFKDDRERLTGKLRRASDYIRQTESNLAKVTDDRKSVARERDRALARIQKLKDNDEDVASLRKENEGLKKSVESTRAELEQTFQKAREELEQRLATQATELERMEELQRINSELAVRLERTEKAFMVATEEKLGRAQLDLIQNELVETQASLQAMREHVERGETQTRLLFAQLEQTTSEITRMGLNPNPTPEQQNLIEEGKLLREIILAQINEQNDRLKATTELEGKIGDLQARSNELTAHIAGLSQYEDSSDASFAVVKRLDAPPADTAQPKSDEASATPPEGAPKEKPTPPSTPAASEPTPTPKASPRPTASPSPSPSPEPTPQAPASARAASPQRQEAVQPAPQRGTAPLPAALQQADNLMAAGNAIEAEKSYRSLLSASPNDPALLTKLAIAQLALGRNTLATSTLKKALAIKPGDVPASINLASAHTRLGNISEAIRILQDVLKGDPNNSAAHNQLGITQGRARGRHLEARESFIKSIELDKTNQNAHFNLAVSYARTAPTSLPLAKKHYNAARKLGASADPSLEAVLEGVQPAR